MCGIVAIFSTRANVDREALARGVRALKHRGPDQERVRVDPDGRAGLGHARLSLVDLSESGAQPLESPSGRLAVVVNGEFYGFEDIRREMQDKGHAFRSGSDSEILLPLYDELGTAALSRLRGEFAFVLWDRSQRTVVAARDRLGIKPLFYALKDGQLLFASEVKALFAMGVPAAWDEASIFDYHQTWLLPAQRTLYRGIFQVPPGQLLIAGGDQGLMNPTIRPYWDFDYPVQSQLPAEGDLEVEAGRLRHTLEEAVRIRLRADVPVACYLSGGLDSCTILGMAAKYAPRPVTAFTVAFKDDPLFDETALAQEAAQAVGAEHHVVEVTAKDLAEHLDAALWHAELPFVNGNGIAKFMLSRAARNSGFKAVLTGEGADEIFGGYLHFRRDVLMDRCPPDLDTALAKLAAANPVASPMMHATSLLPSLRPVQKLLGFVPSFLAVSGEGTARAQGLLRAAFRETFAERDAWQAWLAHIDAPRQLWQRDRLNQALYLWSKTMLPLYLLPILGDRLEMAHSVEGRLPFLDPAVVGLATQLPVGLKIGPNLEEKRLLRAAARPFVPERVASKAKHPFLAPPLAGNPKSPLYSRLLDTINSTAFRSQPFYDPKAVSALVQSLPDMTPAAQAQADVQLLNILSFAVLSEQSKISA